MARHRLRIGEVARRSGVPVELLRAWERRYGVPTPERSASGFRLYSDDEVARVREMRALVDSGVSPAEAARSVSTVTAAPPEPRSFEDARTGMLDAIRAFDEGRVQATLDGLLATLTVETVLSDVVLPMMRDVGEGWARGELTVAHEHFASQLFRGRLLGLARGWSRGSGRSALLACPPREQHDLGLIAFGIALHRLGWRIAYLGADTPFDTLANAADAVDPELVALALTSKENRIDPDAIMVLARDRRVVVGGAAAGALEGTPGVDVLEEDAVAAAERLA